MSKTQLKKLKIEKFRALNNVEIEFGDHITVICGKNGTSKSSILGIAAQIFSFDKDYLNGSDLSFRQITGSQFDSKYKNHFRISDKFDQPGSMIVNIELHDGYTDQHATAKLELMRRGKLSRAVVRKNSTAKKGENESRNFTHPVIFMSLKRLYPISERDYKVTDFQYLNKHKQGFIGLTNELLNRQSSLATGTEGTIKSAVAHGENYDQDSVSAGEDNAGQIILALMSFRKLKEEYADYKGGLLLIDEADAGLFPTAQVNLLKILDRECKDLNLQVVMTSHSPTLIEYAYQKSQEYRRRYKTIYLSNTFGSVQVMQGWSWERISADINTQTIAASEGDRLPKVNIYFEDKEASDFFSALIFRQPIKRYINPMAGVSLGCSNYLELIKKRVPEFAERSVVCLDSDAKRLINTNNPKTVVLLPGELPPDQLVFEYLYNLPESDNFWENGLGFTKSVFTNAASDVIRKFEITGGGVSLNEKIHAYKSKEEGGEKEKNKKIREIFKNFYQSAEFQEILSAPSNPSNPWRHWIENNQDACNKFLKCLELALRGVMSGGYAIDASKLVALKIKPKRG